MSDFDQARTLLRDFKGDAYAFGFRVLAGTGAFAAGQVAALEGNGMPTARTSGRAVLVAGTHSGVEPVLAEVERSLRLAGLDRTARLTGAAPNAPREDVYRLADQLLEHRPDVVVAIGGGSTLDAAKAALVLATLGGPIDRFFGTGQVGEALAAAGKRLTPLIAVQTASSSAAHLTRYSNITDLGSGQKKLIVDPAVVPPCAVFQYDVTTSMSPAFTADGAFDGVSHLIEVLYSAVGSAGYAQAAQIAEVGVQLIVAHLERAVHDPQDLVAREALGLGTDLGGYAIMIGGTSGAHLTSFSLVDILSHGRACAVTNPYYTVFFAPAIEEPLRLLGSIYRDAGLTTADLDVLSGRALGEAVAEAMIALERRIGFPTTLGEVEGFTDGHLARALAAAKDPQLKMKLQNMPVPLTAEMVDDYMGPVLEAARDGDLSRIRAVSG